MIRSALPATRGSSGGAQRGARASACLAADARPDRITRWRNRWQRPSPEGRERCARPRWASIASRRRGSQDGRQENQVARVRACQSLFGANTERFVPSFPRIVACTECSSLFSLVKLPRPCQALESRHLRLGARHPTGGADIPVPAERLVTWLRRGRTGRRKTYGDHRRHHAAIARGRSAFRPPDPPLEPADEAVHLRRPQRRPHHRPVADRAAVRARARLRPADRPRGGKVLFVGTKRQAQDAIAEAAQASRPAFRQPPLARRHADQLEDHLQLDQAPQEPRGAARATPPA